MVTDMQEHIYLIGSESLPPTCYIRRVSELPSACYILSFITVYPYFFLRVTGIIIYDKNSLDFDLTRFYYTLAEGIMISPEVCNVVKDSEGDVSDPMVYIFLISMTRRVRSASLDESS